MPKSPTFEAARSSRLARWVAPKTESLDLHITEHERKLTAEDLETVRKLDPDAIFSRFGIFSRLDRFLLASPRFGPPFLEKVDHSLTRRVAFLGMLGGQVVIELRK
jgi:hypothetical protein